MTALKVTTVIFIIVCLFLGVLLPMWSCIAMAVGGAAIFSILKDRKTKSKALDSVMIFALVVMIAGGIATVFKFIGTHGGSCSTDTNGRSTWTEC
jgi:hypothetical protein